MSNGNYDNDVDYTFCLLAIQLNQFSTLQQLSKRNFQFFPTNNPYLLFDHAILHDSTSCFLWLCGHYHFLLPNHKLKCYKQQAKMHNNSYLLSTLNKM
jgi:hypothetical protein